MNLLSTLKSKIEDAGAGDHAPGLAAVLVHVESALKHFGRGQETGDESLFADVVYRSNQAFEGSLKEAYRVLAEKNPNKKTPSEIENYLLAENVLRNRIVAQLTNYRKDWRNPSTHDYKLDFDESEAFLALISVIGFACVLSEQITGRIAFNESKEKAKSQHIDIGAAWSVAPFNLVEVLAAALVQFGALPETQSSIRDLKVSSMSVLGALAGYISAMNDSFVVKLEEEIGSGSKADLLVSKDSQSVIVELKIVRRKPGGDLDRFRDWGISQLERNLDLAFVSDGILLILGPGKLLESKRKAAHGGSIIVFQPE